MLGLLSVWTFTMRYILQYTETQADCLSLAKAMQYTQISRCSAEVLVVRHLHCMIGLLAADSSCML